MVKTLQKKHDLIENTVRKVELVKCKRRGPTTPRPETERARVR